MSYVCPKNDCPHVEQIEQKELPKNCCKMKCSICKESENWFCLTCKKIFCSRYKNSHMVEHYHKYKHPIVLSFSDLSFWCYECNDYITDVKLKKIYEDLHKEKFGVKPLYQEDKFTEVKKVKKIDIKEYFDDDTTIDKKVKIVVDMIKKSKRTVIYSGAGISTSSGIPDYRGPKGVWTMLEKGLQTKPVDLQIIKPTLGHMVISKMMKKKMVHYVISTNIDGLHIKSGIPKDKICELHGNVFMEKCSNKECSLKYYREYDTTKTVTPEIDQAMNKNHNTGRKCTKCKSKLQDSIIHFKEPLNPGELLQSIEQSYLSELSIVIGTSLRVQPACSLPFYNKKKGGKTILVNLQKTSYDDDVDIKIYSTSDKFFDLLQKYLKL